MTTGKALEIARVYVEAIANKDIETILSISTHDVVCTSPIGQTTGLERFRAFHVGFAPDDHQADCSCRLWAMTSRL
jgi:ketosteroid isomerase-like protein